MPCSTQLDPHISFPPSPAAVILTCCRMSSFDLENALDRSSDEEQQQEGKSPLQGHSSIQGQSPLQREQEATSPRVVEGAAGAAPGGGGNSSGSYENLPNSGAAANGTKSRPPHGMQPIEMDGSGGGRSGNLAEGSSNGSGSGALSAAAPETLQQRLQREEALGQPSQPSAPLAACNHHGMLFPMLPFRTCTLFAASGSADCYAHIHAASLVSWARITGSRLPQTYTRSVGTEPTDSFRRWAQAGGQHCVGRRPWQRPAISSTGAAAASSSRSRAGGVRVAVVPRRPGAAFYWPAAAVLALLSATA